MRKHETKFTFEGLVAIKTQTSTVKTSYGWKMVSKAAQTEPITRTELPNVLLKYNAIGFL